jgi:hypothetical protein
MGTNPPNQPAPDPNYHIAAADRARIPQDFDADALETLLQHMPAESRPSILKQFVPEIQIAVRVAGPDGKEEWHLPDQNILTGFSNPVHQEMLERVWAPKWANKSLRELEAHSPHLPGIEAAKRAARARGDLK